METQKIVNLLNNFDIENSKFATKKWYVIDKESNGKYSKDDPITFLKKSLESNLCDYSDIYILVTGNITVKNCRTEINGTFVENADFINITMPMYNLIEYSDNDSDTSGSLCGFKGDEIDDNEDVTNGNNAPSFKYTASIIGNTKKNGTKNGVKIAVPLKYLCNFWRSLEMPLINCKVKFSLNWIQNCVLTAAANTNKAIFKITDAKPYVPIVTLSAEDNAKLSKLLTDGFKRTVYWNEYKVISN